MSQPPACSMLRTWRLSRGLTQEQAGAKLGVARRTWHQWEAGATVPGPAMMIELYDLTDGLIQPNDFYALPDPRVRKDAA